MTRQAPYLQRASFGALATKFAELPPGRHLADPIADVLGTSLARRAAGGVANEAASPRSPRNLPAARLAASRARSAAPTPDEVRALSESSKAALMDQLADAEGALAVGTEGRLTGLTKTLATLSGAERERLWAVLEED